MLKFILFPSGRCYSSQLYARREPLLKSWSEVLYLSFMKVIWYRVKPTPPVKRFLFLFKLQCPDCCLQAEHTRYRSFTGGEIPCRSYVSIYAVYLLRQQQCWETTHIINSHITVNILNFFSSKRSLSDPTCPLRCAPGHCSGVPLTCYQ